MLKQTPLAGLLAVVALWLMPLAPIALGGGQAMAQMQQTPPTAAAPDAVAPEAAPGPEDRSEPQQEQAAPQAPAQQGPGCNFRNNTLELIV